jgi:hypothetical protein
MRARQLITLAVAGLVNDQATTVLVESDIAAPARALVERVLPPPYSDVVSCRLCAGTWIGIGQAVVEMFDWHPRTATPRRTGNASRRRRSLVAFIIRSLAIAAAGRLSHNLTRDYLHPYQPDA